MAPEQAERAATMRDFVFLRGAHLGVGLPVAESKEPCVPAEAATSAGLRENLSRGLADEKVNGAAVPERQGAAGRGAAIVEGAGDRGEPRAACGLEQPLHVRAGKPSERVEPEGDVFDQKRRVERRARPVELRDDDLLESGSLDLLDREMNRLDGDAEKPARLLSLVRVGGDEADQWMLRGQECTTAS